MFHHDSTFITDFLLAFWKYEAKYSKYKIHWSLTQPLPGTTIWVRKHSIWTNVVFVTSLQSSKMWFEVHEKRWKKRSGKCNMLWNIKAFLVDRWTIKVDQHRCSQPKDFPRSQDWNWRDQCRQLLRLWRPGYWNYPERNKKKIVKIQFFSCRFENFTKTCWDNLYIPIEKIKSIRRNCRHLPTRLNEIVAVLSHFPSKYEMAKGSYCVVGSIILK